MKTILVEQPSLRLITCQSGSFPDGNAAAFERLEKELESLRGRKFYGLIYETEEGIDYFAGLLPLDPDEENRFRENGFSTATIPGGSFARAKIKGWRERTHEIGSAFADIIQTHGIDLSRPQMEYYRSLEELHLLVPVPLENRLREEFLILTNTLQIPREVGAKVFDELTRRYREPHRSYHNLSHIDSMLRSLRERLGSAKEIELAVWFHDVVYDPGSPSNEEDSAGFFSERIGPHLDRQFASKVHNLILATKHGSNLPFTEAAKFLCDLDLEILAGSPERYQEYCDAIRREYDHVSDSDYADGRVAFLKSMLENPIFRTESFVPFEESARANITREIQQLTGLGG
ncbi:MAG: hypothetical protein MI807_17410 [Verrucomicrobiales bacterium]|nr:hypothetical protein [Verrucomicrobiales bacterium]